MNPKKRYENELLSSKQNRTLVMLDAAEHVFTHKGIERTTMQDIATKANLGVATVFRFFPRKDKLVVAVATRNLETVLHTYQSIAALSLSCLEKLDLLLESSISSLDKHDSPNVKILENFDSYAAHYKEPIEDIDIFNSVYQEISKVFSTIVEQGVRDGSIRSDISIEKTLITIIHTFFTFSRKLSLQQNILMVKTDLVAKEELCVLKDLFISYLKN